eukprot:10151772-Heterocapsa_arctica.AAC.1
MSLVRSSATRRDSAMARFKAVISWPTPTTPMMEPLPSWRDVAFRSTVYRSPNLESSGNSKFAVSLPRSASPSTADTEDRRASQRTCGSTP